MPIWWKRIPSVIFNCISLVTSKIIFLSYWPFMFPLLWNDWPCTLPFFYVTLSSFVCVSFSSLKMNPHSFKDKILYNHHLSSKAPPSTFLTRSSNSSHTSLPVLSTEISSSYQFHCHNYLKAVMTLFSSKNSYIVQSKSKFHSLASKAFHILSLTFSAYYSPVYSLCTK